MRSTLAGVFTADQATRGRELYGLLCRSCHAPGTHSPTFKATWSGRPLSELSQYIRDNMPKNDPGSLSPEDNTLVLAYLLQMLGLPAGREELPADSSALKRIRFDTLATKPRTDS
ncbi:MAG: cytochrome c [Gemmatimonadetes bacterium]|nr:cytochrome c [Gemmatimonadota bacterium]